MHNTMTGNVVLFVFVAIEIVMGNFFTRAKKPYNAGLLVIHIILSLFILLGIASGIYVCLKGIDTGKMFATISLYGAGVALLLNVISGVRLLTLKLNNPKLVMVHKITALVAAVLLLARIIFEMAKI